MTKVHSVFKVRRNLLAMKGASFVGGASFASTMAFAGAACFAGGASFASTIGVAGAASLVGNVTACGTVHITGNASLGAVVAGGGTNISGILAGSGNVTFGDLAASAASTTCIAVTGLTTAYKCFVSSCNLSACTFVASAYCSGAGASLIIGVANLAVETVAGGTSPLQYFCVKDS